MHFSPWTNWVQCTHRMCNAQNLVAIHFFFCAFWSFHLRFDHLFLCFCVFNYINLIRQAQNAIQIFRKSKLIALFAGRFVIFFSLCCIFILLFIARLIYLWIIFVVVVKLLPAVTYSLSSWSVSMLHNFGLFHSQYDVDHCCNLRPFSALFILTSFSHFKIDFWNKRRRRRKTQKKNARQQQHLH